MTVRPAFEKLLSNPQTSADEIIERAEPSMKSSLHDLRCDRLGYLADIISELQVLARESQCHVLAGILGLAHAEARQQVLHSTP